MTKNGGKENIVELWGHEFSIAKNGLDETQVVSFIDELINERDLLLKRMEHLSTLTKLAEKTIVEADRLAEDTKKEAKAEAEAILAKADEQTQQMIREKRAEIITIANKEAEVIKANAEREAESLITRQKERIQPEIRNVARQLYGELLSQIEGIMKQVKVSGVEFEHNLSQLLEQTSTVQIEEELLLAQGLVNVPQESSTLSDSSELSLEHAEDIPAESQQPNQIIDQADTSELEEKILLSIDSQDKPAYDIEEELLLPQESSTLSDSLELSLEHTEDISAESQQPDQPVDQANTSGVEEKAPLSVDSQDKPAYDEEVELEILPPLDIKQIMAIVRHLDSLAEVENTELIPLTDMPLVVVSLREPLYLIELLRTFPEVTEVKEIIDEEVAYTEGQRRKIQIVLSGNSMRDEAEENLNSALYNTLPS